MLHVGVNTLYSLFCFFKLFPTVGKGLMESSWIFSSVSLPQGLLST